MKNPRALAPLPLLAALALALGGCSSADDPEPASSRSAAGDDAYPVTLENQFGETVVEEAPERVVTIGFNEQDFALAFGVEPVGVREFLGYDAPNRPWAPDSVRGTDIETVGSSELDLEKIAGLEPDLILGINSYIDEDTYDLLSQIAPTVAESGDVAPGGTTWQDQTLTTGEALGMADEARQLVDDTEQLFADAAEANPDLAGATASFALGSSESGLYSLGRDDYRTGWLTDLGLEVPETGGEVSFEQLDTVFDTDVMLGEGLDGDAVSNPLVQDLAPVADGRFVDLGGFDQDLAAAIGFNSPLSLPFLLDAAIGPLAAAADDDPATVPEPYRG